VELRRRLVEQRRIVVERIERAVELNRDRRGTGFAVVAGHRPRDLAGPGEERLHPPARVEGELVEREDVRRIGHRDRERAARRLERQREVLARESGRHEAQRLLHHRRESELVEPGDLAFEPARQRAHDRRLGDELQIDERLPDLSSPLPLMAERGLQLELIDRSGFDEQLSEPFAHHRTIPSREAGSVPPDAALGSVPIVPRAVVRTRRIRRRACPAMPGRPRGDHR